MKRSKNALVVLSVMAASTMVHLRAQENDEHRFTANIGGGFVTPVYGSGTQLDNGWNLQAGAGMNVIPYLGFRGEFMFNSMGVNSGTLSALQFPGGDMHVWSFTVDPVIHLTPHHAVDLYLIGGPGVYHRYVEFTQPTVATFTGFDPFLGVSFPVGVPANQVLLSYTTTRLGVNG